MVYPQKNNKDVQFDSEQISAMSALYKKTHNVSGSNSKMINFLIKKKIVKNEKVATMVLIGLACVFLLVSAYFFYSTFKPQTIHSIGERRVIIKK